MLFTRLEVVMHIFFKYVSFSVLETSVTIEKGRRKILINANDLQWTPNDAKFVL